MDVQGVDVALYLLRVFVFLFDIITFPIYKLLQQPWKERTKQNHGKVVNTANTNETIAYLRKNGDSEMFKEIIVRNGVDTMTKAFNYAVQKYGEKECLGTRQILGEEDEVQKNGKVFAKLALGEYEWMSYNMVHASVVSFGAGLRFHLKQQPGSLITMYAETRAEWMISCLGAFSQNIAVATVYTNLGDDAVVHAINETKSSVVVTSQDLLPRFQQQIINLPYVKHIIFFEDPLKDANDTASMISNGQVDVIPFREIVTKGVNTLATKSRENLQDEVYPTPEDTAIVMYTSGSTGTPKGVILTHQNLVATMKCLMFMLEPMPDETYIAYLPLAHVLELLSENTMLLFGIKVGYSSPNTMTDKSTKVKSGYKGDAALLKPTILCAVPLILDRIYKNITDSVKQKGPAFQKIFDFCYKYKLKWYQDGKGTPILDFLVFNKIRALLGGRMNWIIVGGAPLSRETHEFIRVCLGAIVVQGYSLTESTCSGTVMENSELTTDTAGKPMAGIEARLVDWEEGEYKVTDRPRPRGEILLAGEPIAKGYFGPNGEIVNGMGGVPSFFEEAGKRWIRTGDIGEFDEEGNLRIIDRKKDLVKLQLGEYVSLGKVEAIMKTNSVIENICVYADPYRSFTVALVVPSKVHLENIAHNLGKTIPYAKLFEDADVIEYVLKDLYNHGLRNRLQKFEIPQAVTLVTEQWTPESGLITASFKMKRKKIQNFYQRYIDLMYEDHHQKPLSD